LWHLSPIFGYPNKTYVTKYGKLILRIIFLKDNFDY
jgi:hypothetical protein